MLKSKQHLTHILFSASYSSLYNNVITNDRLLCTTYDLDLVSKTKAKANGLTSKFKAKDCSQDALNPRTHPQGLLLCMSLCGAYVMVLLWVFGATIKFCPYQTVLPGLT